MKQLLESIRACTICKQYLPCYPRPVLQAGAGAKVLIIGQAPGQKVQQSGIPWNDASGKKLRAWLGVSENTFYDPGLFALVPMGFCYPGKGHSGDLPPRPECAPQWHGPLIAEMKQVKLTLLIGQYAQDYYLEKKEEMNLTETVRSYSGLLTGKKMNRSGGRIVFPLPHPSPRNRFWLTKNKWFELETIPLLQKKVKSVLITR